MVLTPKIVNVKRQRVWINSFNLTAWGEIGVEVIDTDLFSGDADLGKPLIQEIPAHPAERLTCFVFYFARGFAD